MDIENLENGNGIEQNIFEEKYYVYFLVTNIAKEGAIHEGIVEIHNDNVSFKIWSSGNVIKCFTGKFAISDKIIFLIYKVQMTGLLILIWLNLT